MTVGSDIHKEYVLLCEGPALVERPERGLLEVTGKDRASWLHNLVTNQVKPLGAGDGVYAFVLNVQGRILLDLNLLVMPEAIWLDVDRRLVPTAIRHLEKYHMVEDVRLNQRSDEFTRWALVGRRAAELAAGLGAPQAAKMPVLGIAELAWPGGRVTFMRHDFCGPFAIELFVPANQAAAFRAEITSRRPMGAIAVSEEAVQAHRIEAGLPWPLAEITHEYLPAETSQLGRAVSFNKGCYLGQEIVERMRARGALARKLSGLKLEEAVPPAGAQVLDNAGRTVGTVTSACQSIALGCPVAIGYLKTAAAIPGTGVQVAWDGGISAATVAELPFVGRGAE